MEDHLKESIEQHVLICNKVLQRHIKELKDFYEQEIKPIEPSFWDEADGEVQELIECIKQLSDEE